MGGLIAMFALLATGCITSPAVVSLNAPTPLAVAMVVDYPDGRAIETLPTAVQDELAAALAQRNLVIKPIDTRSLTQSFTRNKSSAQRLALLREATVEPHILLIEARPSFFARVSGRYRWDVDVRVTISARHSDAPAGLRQEQGDHSAPAFLQHDHQRGPEAIEAVRTTLIDRVLKTVDRYFAGTMTPTSGTKTTSVNAPAEAIYFAMVDRFANGDSSNDGDIDPTDPQAFHGGDLLGLATHATYLRDLGMTTLWLSPLSAMRTHKIGPHGAFHGYWPLDLNTLEPRFGTPADLDTLKRTLAANGLSLVLDVVLNHFGYEAPEVISKPTWFHRRGNITDWNDPVQLTTHDVHGLPDLDQRQPEVYSYLLKGSLSWLPRTDAAGFRLDAVKHIDLDFWQRYNAAVKAQAGAGFMRLGEVLDGDPQVLAPFATLGGFNALFDFPLHFAMVDVFCRDQPLGRLASVLSMDAVYPADLTLVTLLDNHDLPRIISVCDDDPTKVVAAVDFMLAMRGVPSFTWGTEIGLAGKGEPENRADMRFDTPAHPVGVAIRKGLAQRTAHSALVDGQTRLETVESDLLVVSRLQASQAAVVVVNRGDAPVRWTLPTDLAQKTTGARFVDGPAGEVTVAFVEATRVGGLAALMNPKPASATIEIAVADLPAGADVRVVGAGAKLGNWRFDDAPSRVTIAGTPPVIRLSLPVGTAHAFKLAQRTLNGRIEWEERDNRYLFVGRADGLPRSAPDSHIDKPRAIQLAWGS
ncbi:MAG: glycosidase [Myxococcota bacterium]|jgi:glycosidase